MSLSPKCSLSRSCPLPCAIAGKLPSAPASYAVRWSQKRSLELTNAATIPDVNLFPFVSTT